MAKKLGIVKLVKQVFRRLQSDKYNHVRLYLYNNIAEDMAKKYKIPTSNLGMHCY